LERTILSARRRPQARATPATRYRLIGACATLAELKGLGARPLPRARTTERALRRNNLTAPRARLAPLLPRQDHPGPQARAPNELHEVDLVGPTYRQGRRRRYSTWIGKGAFDGAACLRLATSRRMGEVLWSLGECWKDPGLPEPVQLGGRRVAWRGVGGEVLAGRGEVYPAGGVDRAGNACNIPVTALATRGQYPCNSQQR
jgi:hypothetical protein